MTTRPTFLDRCRHCGNVTDLTSAVEHTCPESDYYNDTYNDTEEN